jgi:peptide/nickel transport system substrate-binding protein
VKHHVRWGYTAIAVFSIAALVLSGSVSYASAKIATAAVAPKHGGTLTYLYVGGTWPGFDPTIDPVANEYQELNAILGQLFELGAHGTVVPDLATGYTISNKGLTYDIDIRHDVKFTDGSSFDAAAVAWNWNRDLASSACTCQVTFAAIKLPVTAIGKYTVQVNLSSLFSPLIPDILGSGLNWVESEQSFLAKGAATSRQDPIGAGPFEIVSNAASAKLVLTKNPHYWEKGHPYLDGITILSTSTDQADFSALVSGQANYTTFATTSLVQQAEHTSGLNVHKIPATFTEFVRYNENAPPFNNPIAREAILYATDPKALVDALYSGLYPVAENETAPGMLFYEKTVPGYDTYDLAKAQALVQQLGGLTVNLRTTFNTPGQIQETSALEAMWSAAGIKTNIIVEGIGTTIAVQMSGGWQAIDAGFVCQPDPSSCLGINFASTGILTGVHDPTLDGLINQSVQYSSLTTRQRIYDKIYALLAKNADADFLYSTTGHIITASNVEGVDPTNSGSQQEYENIWIK